MQVVAWHTPAGFDPFACKPAAAHADCAGAAAPPPPRPRPQVAALPPQGDPGVLGEQIKQLRIEHNDVSKQARVLLGAGSDWSGTAAELG